MVDADDVLMCRDLCVGYLRSVADQDWSTTIPDLDGNVSQMVEHIIGANFWYAIDLAAEGIDADAIEPRINSEGGPESLITALHTVATLLSLTVRASDDDVRCFHNWGRADRSGFAAIGCDEMIVHTHDISRGLGVGFAPNPELASKVLQRLFPWAINVDPDPWTALQWANGRIALPGHECLAEWRSHCAPLDEWDGQRPHIGDSERALPRPPRVSARLTKRIWVRPNCKSQNASESDPTANGQTIWVCTPDGP